MRARRKARDLLRRLAWSAVVNRAANNVVEMAALAVAGALESASRSNGASKIAAKAIVLIDSIVLSGITCIVYY